MAAPDRPGRSSSPCFSWQGLDRHGCPQSGTIAAADLAQARALLRRQGLRVARIAAAAGPATVTTAPSGSRHGSWRQAPISDKQLTLFTRQLATMLQAGLPLLQSLDIAIAGAATPLAALLSKVRRDVAQGESLHLALARHPRHFDALSCQLVLAAEQAGLLDTMLARIATYREKSLALKGKLRAALAYPCAVLLVAVVVTVVIMLWVVPSFEQMFRDFGAELPLATQIVVTTSRWLATGWPLLLGVLSAAILGMRHAWRHSAPLRATLQGASLRLPLLGGLLGQAAMARWSRTCATLLGAGIALTDALETAAGAAGNAVYARASLDVRASVGNGTALHVAMRETGVFNALAVQMTAVGEQSGALDAMLTRLADIHEHEVDDAMTALTSLMEPIIMAVLGLLIGGLVIAMYLPVFSMGSVV